ncbi:MAG: hypothetical protein ACRCX2_09460 [Paraclostridium sp.]
MLSKAHIHMSKVLKKLCTLNGVELLEEVVNGSMRYDFYIPVNPPIIIEVDGTQHGLRKADGHFFKTGDDLSNYLKNDFERKRSAKHGDVVLFNFTTEDFPSVAELQELIYPHIGAGDDENNKFLIKLRKSKENSRKEKDKVRESRKAFIEKSKSWDRPKRKLPGIRGIE